RDLRRVPHQRTARRSRSRMSGALAPRFARRRLPHRLRRTPGGVAGPEAGQHLALVEIEEAFLVGSDLVDADVRVPGAVRLADRVDVALGIGAADDGLGDLLLRDRLERGLEVRGRLDLREERTA